MIRLLNDNFSIMKSSARISMLLLTVACFAVLSSCGGDDEKPPNKITVDGNSIKPAHAYMLSTFGEVEGEEVSEHIIILTTDGLTYDVDEDEMNGSGDLVLMIVGSQGFTLKKGNYEFGDDDFEDLYFLRVGLGVEDGLITEAVYDGTDGNLQVKSISETKITLKFDFSEYDFETHDDFGTAEESLKGYYSGAIEITEQEEPGKIAQKHGVMSRLLKR